MPTNNLPGGSPVTTSNSSDTNTHYYSSFGVPFGRTMQNGSRNVIMESFLLYVSGRNGTTSARAHYAGSNRGSYRSIGQSANPGGWAFAVGVNSAAGSNQTYGFYSTAGCYFKRGSGGGSTTNAKTGYQWGTALSGTYTYSEAPPAPTTPAASNVTSTSMTVKFNSNGDGGSTTTGWKLQRATNSAFTQNVVTVNSTGTTNVTGLNPNTTYYFRASGQNAVTTANGSLGPWSGTLTQTTSAGVPSAPRSVAATAINTTTTKLTWVAPSSNGGSAVTGYRVQYANNSGFTGATSVDLGNVLTWTSPSLSVGTWYFRVLAKNTNGNGSWSSAVSNVVTLLGYVKAYDGEDFVGNPVKVYLAGTWVQKPMKVRKGNAWVTLP